MDFEAWLKVKLRELNTDENVFSSYFQQILDGEETLEEKTEALEGILSEIIDTDIPIVLNEIIDKWKSSHVVEQPEVIEVDNVETKLAKLLESQKLATIVQKEYTAEELRIRKQILEQYSQLSGDEDEDIGNATVSEPSSASGMVKNTNAHDVQQALKERREQAKLDSKQKKEKDKEDREKQKQQREDKKEKRKTVKGERRR